MKIESPFSELTRESLDLPSGFGEFVAIVERLLDGRGLVVATLTRSICA